jgi:hypothetical protein
MSRGLTEWSISWRSWGFPNLTEKPDAYAEGNLVEQLTLLELCIKMPEFEQLVYVSLSSVYEANERLPFCATDQQADLALWGNQARRRIDEILLCPPIRVADSRAPVLYGL